MIGPAYSPVQLTGHGLGWVVNSRYDGRPESLANMDWGHHPPFSASWVTGPWPKIIPELERRLQGNARVVAAQALSHTQHEQALGVLIEARHDPYGSPGVLQALARYGEAATRPMAEHILDHLGDYEADRTVSLLVALLLEDERLRSRLSNSLVLETDSPPFDFSDQFREAMHEKVTLSIREATWPKLADIALLSMLQGSGVAVTLEAVEQSALPVEEVVGFVRRASYAERQWWFEQLAERVGDVAAPLRDAVLRLLRVLAADDVLEASSILETAWWFDQNRQPSDDEWDATFVAMLEALKNDDGSFRSSWQAELWDRDHEIDPMEATIADRIATWQASVDGEIALLGDLLALTQSRTPAGVAGLAQRIGRDGRLLRRLAAAVDSAARRPRLWSEIDVPDSSPKVELDAEDRVALFDLTCMALDGLAIYEDAWQTHEVALRDGTHSTPPSDPVEWPLLSATTMRFTGSQGRRELLRRAEADFDRHRKSSWRPWTLALEWIVQFPEDWRGDELSRMLAMAERHADPQTCGIWAHLASSKDVGERNRSQAAELAKEMEIRLRDRTPEGPFGGVELCEGRLPSTWTDSLEMRRRLRRLPRGLRPAGGP